MQLEEIAAAPVSPCVGVCRLRGEVCEGCGRNLDEIASWPAAGNAKKQAIVIAARNRLAIIEASLPTSREPQ